jgi:hypothetical protein
MTRHAPQQKPCEKCGLALLASWLIAAAHGAGGSGDRAAHPGGWRRRFRGGWRSRFTSRRRSASERDCGKKRRRHGEAPNPAQDHASPRSGGARGFVAWLFAIDFESPRTARSRSPASLAMTRGRASPRHLPKSHRCLPKSHRDLFGSHRHLFEGHRCLRKSHRDLLRSHRDRLKSHRHLSESHRCLSKSRRRLFKRSR